jgi:hypothetical protein
MNRRLRSPDMEQTFSFSTVSGTTNYALSSRVRELRELYASTTATDADAIGYTVTGETVVFDDDPGDDLTITYSAYVTLSGLSSGNPTNWLLDDHPDAYLAGTLAAAYAFERDEAQAANFDALLERTIDEIKKEANQKRLPAGPDLPEFGHEGLVKARNAYSASSATSRSRRCRKSLRRSARRGRAAARSPGLTARRRFSRAPMAGSIA